MKNLLNLKGLRGSSQLALNSDGQTTVERRSNDGHVRRHLSVGLTKLLSLFLLLTLGVGQMWGGTHTIYVSGFIFSSTWDNSSSTLKIGYNYNPNSQWTGHQDMTKTDFTYQGYPIYSASVTSSNDDAKIYFYHYKNGAKVDADYQASDGSNWVNVNDNDSKLYLGYQDNAHRWVDLRYDATIYFIKNANKISAWNPVKAYAWDGSYNNSNNTWPGQNMTNTEKTYKNSPIYSITFDNPPYRMVKFDGGNSDNESGNQTIPGNEGKMFDYQNNTWLTYAYDHDVIFNANGGSGTMTNQTMPYNTATAIKTNSFTKSGYTFNGWNTTADGSGTAYAAGGNITVTDADVTLYAQWKQTVTLHDNNGGSKNGSAIARYNNAGPFTPTAPTKTGYHIESADGYYAEVGCTNKVMTTAGALVNYSGYVSSGKWVHEGATTLYAKWTVNSYTIAFNANDANYVGTATGSTASIDATYDVNYTLTSNGFTRAGYTFAGWTQNADGSGTQYTDGQTGVSNLTATNGETVTLYAKWTPQTYTVTLNYGMGAKGDNPASVTATMGATYASSTGLLSSELPTVADPSGYYFTGWYSAAEGGDKIENTTIVEKAYDHTIYAQFTPITYVYFYNNLNWSNVYVTYDAYWNESNGTGNNGKIYHQMEPIGGNIYRDQVPEDIIRSWKYHIAFNDTKYLTGGVNVPTSSGNYEYYNGGKAVFRRDFDSYATMFVPHNANSFTKNDPSTTYQSSAQWVDHQDNDEKKDIIDYRYQDGYWMVYNASDAGEAGYVLKGTWDSEANDFYFKKTAAGNDYTVTKYLPAGQTYNFRIYKHCKTSNTYSSWFINNSGNTITTSVSNYSLNTAIAKSETTKYDHLTTSVAGDYTFTLTCGEDGILKLSVKYPDLAADADWYRLLYTWNDGSAHSRVGETFQRPDDDGETEWTDAFIHHQDGTTIKSRSLKLQKYVTVSSTPTWSDVQLLDLSSITKNGVYTFKITRASGEEAVASYVRPFEGDYYLRSDITDGGWDYYIGSKQVMTYSDYSTTLLTDPYSHYYCKYINNDENRSVAFTVATANTPSLCDTLVGDAIIGVGNATLYKRLPSGHPANVRFMYNENTNTIKRAYLKSAQGTGNARYLVLHGTDHVFKSDGTPIAADGASSLAANELLFTDKGNWVYEINLKASPIAKAKVIARYNGSDASADRYLVGGSGDTDADWKVILGGDEDLSNKYDLSGVYDFKTNRLMMAWKPTGEAISAKLSNVDMLWVREGDNPAQQIKFSGSGELTNVDVIGAIKFDKTGTNGFVGSVGAWNATTRPKLKYFISFPFDVAVSDIFGFNKATYGDEYVVQKYNGAARAEKGLFAGDDGTFWEDLTTDSIMHANEGYCLIMDNEYLNDGSHAIWENVPSSGSIYLYFPATAKVASISGTTTPTTVKEHTYRFDRPWASNSSKNHNVTDSHWNLIGSPLFQNTTFVGSGTTLTSYYRWHYDNTWKPWVTSGEAGTNAGSSNVLNAMNCIMVQWHGTISWSATESSGPETPASLAARRTSEKKNHTLKLELLRNEEPVDWAFVEMRDGAQKDFVLCEDMMKIQNSGKPNLYLYAGGYDVAYSQVPVETQTIPVGVIIRQNGTYTFSMPSNFDGTVTLIDKFAQTRTNLALGDYEVTLERGTINDRFELEINIRNVPTAIDGVTDGSGSLKDGKAHKFIENGAMYILRDGQVFDARGNKVK